MKELITNKWQETFRYWTGNVGLFNILISGTGFITICLLGYFELVLDLWFGIIGWFILMNFIFFFALLIGILLSNNKTSIYASENLKDCIFWWSGLLLSLLTVVTVSLFPFLFF